MDMEIIVISLSLIVFVDLAIIRLQKDRIKDLEKYSSSLINKLIKLRGEK